MPHQKRNKDPLLGWPGYRTRSNRSGYDPIDTRNEAAHMEGTFLRNLFTLQLRTRVPFYLILMVIFGVIPFVTLVFLIANQFAQWNKTLLVLISPPVLGALITGAVTLNFLLSLLEIFGFIAPRPKASQLQVRARRKKLPKRRKDFR